MNRIDRLFAIHTYLQSRRYVPAETIAEKWSISVRTVYRDIRALQESGVPVSFEPGRGYCVMQGYFLPPVSFSTEEAGALLLMEGATKVFADQSIQALYASALTKVRAVLRAGQKEGIDVLMANTGIQLPSCWEAQYAYLSTLQKSVSERLIIAIAYRNKAGEASVRELEPVGLQFYAMAWHLMAWCHLREEYRDFKVSRMESVRLTGEPFRRKHHITLEAFRENLPVNF